MSSLVYSVGLWCSNTLVWSGKTLSRLLSLSPTNNGEFCIRMPYYAASNLLPAPLPTNAEIELLRVATSSNEGRCVLFFPPHFVVKCGSIISLVEGQNMLFVSQRSDVRVPQVYAIYTEAATKINYIIMEYIEGETLQSVWPTLSSLEKVQITSKLRSYLGQLRALPSPGYYGSLGKLHFLNNMFWYPESPGQPTPRAISGPFDTEDDLNEALVLKYLELAKDSERYGHKALFYRRAFRSIFQAHKPVFTHADFQRKNIMITKSIKPGEPGK